jgi:hypothetical protein
MRDDLLGPYRLERRIAVGGMAEVFRAIAPSTAGEDRSVVVKRLLPSLARDPEQRRMFAQEARLGRCIQHPNVVQLLDHGEDERTRPYLVLEWVFGVDLWRLLRSADDPRLSLPLAAFIGREMLTGLAAVHDARDERGAPLHLVHRDVSPQNLFLSVHGDVKLGDLGIARNALRQPRKRTVGARAKGKLHYLSPEAVAGRPVDRRSDLFAAAAVVAEMLLGEPLFGRPTEIAALLAVRDGDLSSLDRLEAPADLVAGLRRALAVRPERRTARAEELRAVLAPYASDPDEPALRQDLGERVVAAYQASAGRTDRRALAATVESGMAAVKVPPSSAEEIEEEMPRYRVEGRAAVPAGQVLGRIALGQIPASARVSVDGGAPRAVEEVPELARHLPPRREVPEAPEKTREKTQEVHSLDGPDGVLPLFVRFAVERRDGLLVCEAEGLRKEVFLREGTPVYVTSNQPHELLGEHLVAEGVIPREDLDLALALLPRHDGRLGETLVSLSLLEPMEVVQQLTLQVEEKLLSLYAWRGGSAALYAQGEPPARAFPLGFDAWQLLLAGARRRAEAGLASPLPEGPWTLEEPAAGFPEGLPDAFLDLVAALRDGAPVADESALRVALAAGWVRRG